VIGTVPGCASGFVGEQLARRRVNDLVGKLPFRAIRAVGEQIAIGVVARFMNPDVEAARPSGAGRRPECRPVFVLPSERTG